jgi:sec-independent protein translocase protein TatB
LDISWTELLVVAVVAIVVVGPKELPGMLRTVGKMFGQVRRTAREFQSTFNDALREAERQAALDDVKKGLDEVRRIDPTKDLRSTVASAQKDVNAAVSGAGSTAMPQTPVAPAAPVGGPVTPAVAPDPQGQAAAAPAATPPATPAVPAPPAAPAVTPVASEASVPPQRPADPPARPAEPAVAAEDTPARLAVGDRR